MTGDESGDLALALGLFAFLFTVGLCIILRKVPHFVWKRLTDPKESLYAVSSQRKLKKAPSRLRQGVKRRLNSHLSEVVQEKSTRNLKKETSIRKALSHQLTGHLAEVVQTARKGDGLHVSDISHSARAERAVVTNFRASLSKSVFTSHIRYESNFTRGNADPELKVPPVYTTERAIYVLRPSTLLAILVQSVPVYAAILNAVGLSFLMASFSCFVWYVHLEYDAPSRTASKLVMQLEAALSHVLGGFRFFPAFLLLGLLGYIVSRWRDFLVNSHTVQARLHDIGVAVGGSVIDSTCPKTRSNIFKLYRYLNVVHSKTYASVNPHVPQSDAGFLPQRLLTPEEVRLLANVPNKSRDMLITWIQVVVERMIRAKQVRELAIDNSLFCGLRGITARHMDLFVRNMPNVWYAVCHVIVSYLVLLQALHVALQLDPKFVVNADTGELADDRKDVLCMNVFCVLIFSFMAASIYWIAESMVEVLIQPFKNAPDAYNSDALLCSTDRMLFTSLRATFDYADADVAGRSRFVRRRWANAVAKVTAAKGSD